MTPPAAPKYGPNDPRFRWMRPHISIFCGLLILIQIGGGGVGGGATGGADSDPWDEAISYAQSALSNNPNLVQHLREYQSMVGQIDSYLSVVERLGPVLDGLEDFKQQEVMGVSVWDALMDGLDLVVSGASDAIAELESGLRSLTTLRQRLVALYGVESVAQRVEAFEAQPSRQTLEALASEAGPARSALQSADQTLGSILGMLSGLTDKVSKVERALSMFGGLPIIPSQLTSGLEDLVSGLTSPLHNLEQDGQELQQRIQQDLSTLDDIIAAAEYGLNPGSAPPLGGRRAGSSDLTLVFVILGGVLGGAALVAGLVLYGRRRAGLPASAAPLAQQTPESVRGALAPAAEAMLVAESGPNAGQQIPVPAEGLLIGRAMSSGLRLEEPIVSRNHARLRFAGDAWFLQDQSSAGGTFVNGNRILAQRLNPGDRITIGSTSFIFQA